MLHTALYWPPNSHLANLVIYAGVFLMLPLKKDRRLQPCRFGGLEITWPCRTVLVWHRFAFALKRFVLLGVACVVRYVFGVCCFFNLSAFKNLNVCFGQPWFVSVCASNDSLCIGMARELW